MKMINLSPKKKSDVGGFLRLKLLFLISMSHDWLADNEIDLELLFDTTTHVQAPIKMVLILQNKFKAFILYGGFTK